MDDKPWEKYSGPPAVDATPAGPWQNYGKPAEPFRADPGEPYRRFAGGVYKNTIGAIPGLVSEFMAGQQNPPPLTTPMVPGGIARIAQDAVQSQVDTGKKAFQPGLSVPERIGYGAAGLLPLVGPPAAAAGERIGSGDIAGGLGEATGLLAPFALKAAQGALPHVVPDSVPENLRTSAVESYSRALAPTKEKFKALTKKVVEGQPGLPSAGLPPTPGLIERGTMAMTRKGLQQKFAGMVDDLGNRIDAMQAQVPVGSKYLPYQDVVRAIDNGLDERFTIDTPNGRIPAGPDAVNGLRVGDKLKAMLKAAKETDPNTGQPVLDYQIMRRFKQNWDNSIAEAGGFANKDFVNNAKMGAYKESANAIRAQLNAATPDIAAINREFSFWKNAQDVIDETIKRATPQSQALGQQMAQVAGRAAGAATKGVSGAILYGETLKAFRKLTTSTGWNTASAVLKNHLANYLATGQSTKASALMNSMMATPRPANLPPLTPPPEQ